MEYVLKYNQLIAMKGVLFVIFLLSSLIVNAQWEWQNPRPQGYSLSSLAFSDHNNGVAVGEHGTILITSNGGENWNLMPRLTNNSLIDVVPLDSATYMAYSGNEAFRSVDNGKTWALMGYSPGLIHTGRVKFLSDSFGLAYGCYFEGYTLFKSIDGGMSWQPKLQTGYNTISDVAFSDSTHGFVMNYDSVYRTIDGAESFVTIDNLLQQLKPFSVAYTSWVYYLSAGLYSPNGNIEYCKLLKSYDNGNTWALVADSTVPLSRLYFIDSSRGFGVYSTESRSYVYYTNNGGVTWDNLYHASDPEPIICINDSASIFLIHKAKIFKWKEDVMNWELKTSGIDQNFNSMQFVNDSVGYAESSNSTVLKTTDGGKTWVPKTVGSYKVFSGLTSFSDADNGIVASFDTLHITHDGAETWNAFHEPLTSYLETCQKIDYIDPSTVYLLVRCMNAGYTKTWYKLLRSNDTLGTWSEFLLPEGAYYDMMFVNSMTGFLTGGSKTYFYGDGFVLKTIDGGQTWVEMEVEGETHGIFNKIQMFDLNTGVVEYSNPGVQTKLLPITNGIVLSQPLWTHVDDIHSTFNPYPFHFFSHELGFVLYDNELYRLQSDSIWGPSWSLFGEFPGFNNLCFSTPTNGFLYYNNMLIHLSPHTGPLGIEERIFSTRSSFFRISPIPASSNVDFNYLGNSPLTAELWIFNFQGQKIMDIENLNLTSHGRFTIDVSGLRSGMYIYKVNTSLGEETGKLIITK